MVNMNYPQQHANYMDLVHRQYGRAAKVVVIQDFRDFESYLRPHIRTVLFELSKRGFFVGRYPVEICIPLYEWIIAELYEKVYGLSCRSHYSNWDYLVILGSVLNRLPRLHEAFGQCFVGPRLLGCQQTINISIEGMDLRLIYFKEE